MNAEQYIESLYLEDADLQRVIQGIRKRNMPEISIAPGYGRLLTLLVKTARAEKALEIGALGGYSGICIARGLEKSGKLYSLELNTSFVEVAKEHLVQAGLGDQVEYMIGDAKDSLKQLQEKGERFDFFFIDADKASYPTYLETAIQLARPGAIIVGDNTWRNGKIVDESDQSNSIKGMREFNQRLTSDPRLDSTMLPAYDGLAIARVKA